MSALAAASVGYWGVKGWGPAVTAPPATVALTTAPPAGALARALGGGKVLSVASVGAPATISRYALLGVVASRGRDAALISVDGQEAKPVRVGHPVDDRLVLQSVTARQAVLGTSLDAPAQFTLELPLPGS